MIERIVCPLKQKAIHATMAPVDSTAGFIIVIVIQIFTVIVIAIVISVFICHLPFFAEVDLWFTRTSILSMFCQLCLEKKGTLYAVSDTLR